MESEGTLQPVNDTEIPAVVRLMNSAYRGTGSVKSWNTETGVIEGDRTTEELLPK